MEIRQDPVTLQNISDNAAHVFASVTSSGLVTKSDSTVLKFKALWIGTAGDVSVDHTEGGAAAVFFNVPGGAFFEVSGVRVNAATTADDMRWVDW
jgi:hypothetical protein